MGIKGIGVVNALEIVHTFRDYPSLLRFKEWAIRDDSFLEQPEKYYQSISQKELEFKQLHKKYKRAWEMTPDFPSLPVIQGYQVPLVDHSLEAFQWKHCALDLLEAFCRQV